MPTRDFLPVEQAPLIGGLPVDLALAFHIRVGFFSRDFVPAVQWLREFPFLRQVVIDRRMILVLPGRRQRFICFSCTEKIYYLFLIFVRTSKYARAL